MMSNEIQQSRRKLLIYANIVIAALIFVGIWEYWQATSRQLWNQSVNSIIEITEQGANTLKSQLQFSQSVLEEMAGQIERAPDMASAMSLARSYAQSDSRIYLFLADGTAYPEGPYADKTAYALLQERREGAGTLPTHSHSVTGLGVFDQYIRISRPDGGDMYLLQEFKVSQVSDYFTMSFMDNAGKSYVVDTEGQILLRPVSATGQEDIANIFANTLHQPDNEAAEQDMRQAMSTGKTGWGIVNISQEDMLLVYRPVGVGSDWYMLSLVPVSIIDQKVWGLVENTALLLFFAIVLLAAMVWSFVRRQRKTHQLLQEQGEKLANMQKLSAEQAEDRHRQEKQLFMAALADTYPVIGAIDLEQDEFQFIYVNGIFDEELGKSHSYQRTCRNMRSRIHPDYLSDFDSVFMAGALEKRLRSIGSDIWCHVQMLTDDGEYHWVAMQVVPLVREEAGGSSGVFLARIFDEQKQREEAERQILKDALDSARYANEAKSKFLSNMSHDIRTPLNAILGMTTIVAKKPEDKAYVLEGLRKISMSGHHLLGLINDILDMSKIESGKMSLQLAPFDISELIADTVELVRPQLKSGKLTLHMDLAGINQRQVQGDALRVRQVLLNIISNAVKYTEPGGAIYITANDKSSGHKGLQQYVFICKDTGIGMSEEFLQNIFEPFERARNSTSSKILGTGLGMSITKNLVDMMGGTIQVESQEHQGSTFTVTLPLTVEETAVKPEPETNEAPQQAENAENAENAEKVQEQVQVLEGRRALLVDDNEINLEIGQIFIEEAGLQVEIAMDGQEAVDKVAASEEGYYDIVFMDIQMPVMDGYEAARQIRALQRQDVGTMKIIALTANAFEEDIQNARQAGMDGHVPKPIELPNLLKMLHECFK